MCVVLEQRLESGSGRHDNEARAPRDGAIFVLTNFARNDLWFLIFCAESHPLASISHPARGILHGLDFGQSRHDVAESVA